MNVLVIAPHPGDESVGCGGTVCLHTRRNDRVTAAFLTSGERGVSGVPEPEVIRIRELEARKAASILGLSGLAFFRYPDGCVLDSSDQIIRSLRGHFIRERADLIYLPHPVEWHPDHRASLAIITAAIGDLDPKPLLLGYEIWTPLAYYDRAEDVSDVFSAKMMATRCHVSQLSDIPYDRAIAGLNQYRGALALRRPYAEVFQELR